MREDEKMKNIGLAIAVLFLLLDYSVAQETRPIIVSPIIGEKLDGVEEEYFRLVPAFNNVQEAEFYLNPDSSLNVLVKYKYNGEIKDTLIMNYITLVKLRDYIDYQLTEERNDAQNIERGKFANVSTVRDSIIEGELLSVNKTSVVLLNLDKESYKQPNIPPFDVRNIYNTEISKLTVFEESNIANLIYPLVLGIGVGSTAAYIKKAEIESRGPKPLSEGLDELLTPILHYFLGAAAGGLIGYLLSEIFPIISVSETEYDTPFNEEDIEGLRKVTRYK